AQNKADDKYVIVGAASIIAKVERDQSIGLLEQKYDLNGFLGSGYPNNQLLPFIEEYRNQIKNRNFPFIRYEWDWPPLSKIVQNSNLIQAKLF
ncbi:MAG: ribonuclease HII, partial [Candidatus Hodarchaeales archaeon]